MLPCHNPNPNDLKETLWTHGALVFLWKGTRGQLTHLNNILILPKKYYYWQQDMEKRTTDSNNRGFSIIQFYKLHLHTPNLLRKHIGAAWMELPAQQGGRQKYYCRNIKKWFDHKAAPACNTFIQMTSLLMVLTAHSHVISPLWQWLRLYTY